MWSATSRRETSVGKAVREKRRAERKAHEAEFGVFCPGMLEVLSIGHGDMKVTLDTSKPREVEAARKLIEEMLRKGYSIFVETDGGPIKVREFNPTTMAYVIVDDGEVVDEPDPEPEREKPSKRAPGARKRAARTREVPVAGSKATAVGRTSGG